MKNGPFQFKLWYLLAVVLIVGLAVGVSYFKNASTDENSQPPSLKIGSVLLKGQAVKNGLVKYDDADKDKSNNANYGSKVSANVNKGVGFYYTDEDITLDKLLDSSQCLNANVGRTLFFSYSPGGEPGAEKDGFYVYPEVLASGGNTGIADSSKYLIKKGRVFGLYSDNPVTGHCFKDAKTNANIVPDFGALKNGWVQIAAKDNKLSTIIEPVKNCVNSVWVQDGIDSFDTKIPAANYATHNLGNYKLLWINLKDCGAADQSEGLTAADIAGMTPVLSQSSAENNFIKLTWTAVSENIKGNTLQHYVLETVAMPEPLIIQKNKTETELKVASGKSYAVKVCAKYENPLAVAKYCSNELTLIGPVAVADAGVVISDAVLVNNKIKPDEPDVELLAVKLLSDRDMFITFVTVTIGGTGDPSHLGNNFQLKNVNGNVLATANRSGNKLMFNVTNYKVDKGSTVFKLVADVKDSAMAGEVFKFSIESAGDIKFTDFTIPSGSFPIVQTVTVADAVVQDVVVTKSPLTKNTFNAGDAASVVLAIEINGENPPMLTNLVVNYTGDIQYLENFRLEDFGGTVIEKGVVDGSKIVFNLSEPVIAEYGFVIRVDIKKSAPTSVYKFSILSSSDIVFDLSSKVLGPFPLMQDVNIKADTKPGVVQNLEVETAPILGDMFGTLKGKAKLFWDPVVYPAGSIKFYEVWYGSDFNDKSKYQSTTFVNNSYGVEINLEDGKYWFKVRAIGEIGGVEHKGNFSSEVVGTVI